MEPKLYDPSRKKLGAAVEFLKENLNVAAQYADWATARRSRISRSDRARKRSDNQTRLPEACRHIKDCTGRSNMRSAVCTHLYCIVTGTPPKKLGLPMPRIALRSTERSSTDPRSLLFAEAEMDENP